MMHGNNSIQCGLRVWPNIYWSIGIIVSICLIEQDQTIAQVANSTILSVDQIQQVDQAIQVQVEQQRLVGVAIGVIRQGQIAYTQGYGWADQRHQVPMTSQSLIRWASVSKPVTAVIAGQLVAEGKLSFDDDVRSWVPEFPDQGLTIRVRDLLCHQSGIVHYSNGQVIRTRRNYDSPNPFQDVILALNTFKASPLIHAPGEKFSYSTHAYILLSAVTERAEGKPFHQQLQDRICQPLGLSTLQPDYQWNSIADRVVGYRMVNDGIRESSNTDVSWKLGGGGMISSVDDMARFACALLSDELLSEEIKQQMWVRQKTTDGTETNVGLGFYVDGEGRSLKISHNGSQEKARTRLVIYPRGQNGVVVMSNCEYADPGKISTAIYNVLQRKN